ncbi:hypothetical protein OIA45_39670 [Streptomyces chartreusis]|uniref:hypothetical protein n=1 Tax=Streptomyces chartreusis TaxID=1969 RepID=UPI0038648E97|nr:hypothetical protein OIA45_39670 [Streptomyces chartreusis]
MTLDDSLTALAIATFLGAAAALTILSATAYLMVCRAIEAHRRVRGRHQHIAAAEQDQAAIEQADHDPQPMLDAIRDLHEACCDRWWTSLATDHDPTCPNQPRKEVR